MTEADEPEVSGVVQSAEQLEDNQFVRKGVQLSLLKLLGLENRGEEVLGLLEALTERLVFWEKLCDGRLWLLNFHQRTLFLGLVVLLFTIVFNAILFIYLFPLGFHF